MQPKARVSIAGSGRTTISKRSKSINVRLLSAVSGNCDINISTLIEEAKNSAALGPVTWDDATWEVEEFQRGHKQRASYLHFTVRRDATLAGTTLGRPFSNDRGFADLVKALIRKRAEIGRQGGANQREMLIAYRYLYDELEDRAHDVRRLHREHFDRAVKAVKSAETALSAYKRIQKLEEIARTLDECRLVLVKLEWTCGANSRPAMAQDKLDDPRPSGNGGLEPAANARSKLPAEGIIEGVAHLYNTIPKDAWADRLRICLVCLLVITGFRIGELLTLRAQRVQVEEGTGRKFIIYYPEKGAPPQKKWLMTVAGELATDLIDEILALTSEARSTAKWLFDNPGLVRVAGIDLSTDYVDVRTIGTALGMRTATAFLETRKVPVQSVNGRSAVESQTLVEVLRQESYHEPVNRVKNTGEELFLKDALACVAKNAFHPGRTTLSYAVLPISEQQLSDFMGGREGAPSAFERYVVKDADGNGLSVNSHAFRHWLNDLLDRGGLSDLEQATYFGRKHHADNRAYQTMTQRERVRAVRERLMSGKMCGPIANVIKNVPIGRREVFGSKGPSRACCSRGRLLERLQFLTLPQSDGVQERLW